MNTYVYLWQHPVNFFSEWEMFQTYVVHKLKTHFMFNNIFFNENRAVYEKMRKNMIEPDRP